MNEICIVVAYIGNLPNYYPIWKKTIEYNRNIDFMIITDQDVAIEVDNLIVHKLNLDSIRELAEKAIGKKVCLDKPYKLCDYRPMYGLIFKDYLADYDFWGHTDLDVAYGQIDEFLPATEDYDKIYELGHLTLYRNIDKMNKAYLLKGGYDYDEMISSNDAYYFDEVSIREKCRNNGIEVYCSKDYADISPRHKRFTLSNDLLTKKEKRKNNHSLQVFYWENGHVYRAYVEKNVIKLQEFNYLHFQKRKMKKMCSIEAKSFFVTAEGFVEKELGIPSIEQIKQYNHYPGWLYERYEDAKFWYFEYKKRLGLRIKRLTSK